MAELIGLIASVITVTEVAMTVSGKMMGLAKELSLAGEEIEDFAIALRGFYIAVDLSLNGLDRYTKTSALKESPVLKRLLETGGFELLKEQSKRNKRRIRKAWKVAKGVKSTAYFFEDALTAINWVFRKSELLALSPQLADFKLDILLVINSLILEMKLDSVERLESCVNLDGSHYPFLEKVLHEKLAEMYVVARKR